MKTKSFRNVPNLKNKTFKFKNPSKNILSGQKLPFTQVIIVTFVLSLFTVLVPFIFKKNLPPETPLFYGLPEGEKQLSAEIGLAIPGIISLCIALINTFLALFLKERFLKQTLLLASLGVSLLACITVIKIVILVGSF